MGDKYLAVQDIPTAKAFHMEAIQLIPGLDGDVRNRLSKILQPSDMVPGQVVEQLKVQLQQLQSQITKVEVARQMSEIEKNKATTEKTMQDIQQTKAETLRTMEEAANKGLENDILRSGNYTEASVSI